MPPPLQPFSRRQWPQFPLFLPLSSLRRGRSRALPASGGAASCRAAGGASRPGVLSREDPETGIVVPVHEGDEPQPGDSLRPGYMVLLCSPAFGGRYKYQSPVFQPGGEYSGKVVARLGGVQDPLAEAVRLAATLVRHADGAHNPLNEAPMGDLGNALDHFRTAL